MHEKIWRKPFGRGAQEGRHPALREKSVGVGVRRQVDGSCQIGGGTRLVSSNVNSHSQRLFTPLPNQAALIDAQCRQLRAEHRVVAPAKVDGTQANVADADVATEIKVTLDALRHHHRLGDIGARG